MASQIITFTVAGTDYTATNPGGRGRGNEWRVSALGLTIEVPQLKWPADDRLWTVGGDVRIGGATGPIAYRAKKANGVFNVSWVRDGAADPPLVYAGASNADLWHVVHEDWRRRVISDYVADHLAAATTGDDAPMAESPETVIADTPTDAVSAVAVPSDPDALIESIARIRAYERDGRTAPYQFLVLTWAISRARSGAPRLTPFDATKAELLGVLSQFRVADTEPDPVDPWYALRNTDWWELAPPIPETVDDVRRLNTAAGLRRGVYDLVARDATFAERALAKLAERIDNRPDQQYDLVELGLSAATAPTGHATDVPTHESVPVENSFTEQFAVAYEAIAAAERTRSEALFQQQYKEHLEALGHTVTRKRINVDGQTLFSDLYDEDTDDLIEVKSLSDRVTMRLALGQILDYAFVVKPALLTVVVPDEPASGIIRLCREHEVRVVWPDARGVFGSKDA